MALSRTGKVLYGVVFLLLLPVGLIVWASASASAVEVPLAAAFASGTGIAAAGTLLLLLGMRSLWVYGGGLPMNIAAPPRYVARGAYRFLLHPIYIGFCILCVGVSLSRGSASGLWLVCPVVMMGCAALVLGYEQHDLRRRFGTEVRGLMPKSSEFKPSPSGWLAVYLCVLAPWLVLYCAVHLLPQPPAESSVILSPAADPFLLIWNALYASAFVVIAIAPLFARTSTDLRKLAMRCLLTMAFALLLFLGIPVFFALLSTAQPRGFAAGSLLDRLALESGSDGRWIFFPSFAVMFAALADGIFAERGPLLRSIVRTWALLVAVSCLYIRHLGILTVLSGFAAVVLAYLAPATWRRIRAASEWVANSWREWRIGPVRIINHGLYVGIGGFVSLAIGLVLAGPGNITAVLVAAFLAVIGAALWAQLVEGSPQLLRPYGFYGGLLGGIAGALVAPLFHTSPWLVLAVFSAGGSFGQGLGRLRCLVQGCCHGMPASGDVGIRYVHPSSRVCRLSEFARVPIHPTPTYSLLWNGVVALVVLRLWTLHATLPLITGAYFILNGVGRFVEESYRGEPQTKVIAGLRLYQWAAIASVLLGIIFTSSGYVTPAPAPSFRWITLVPAAIFGLFVGAAMGVDFPDSNRRFSRLA